MKIAFLHPDLGIGGAERLVVDAAIALQAKGHDVTIVTSHHDPKHCFEETRDGTLKVIVLGNSVFPRSIQGRGAILCAILRQMHLTQQLASKNLQFDVFVVDQLSAAVPALRLKFPRARILFYCHYPDLLLTERKNLAKRLYRIPFDMLERWSTSLADTVAVNSNYTKGVFYKTFGKSMPEPSVVYPVVEPNFEVVHDHHYRRKLERLFTEPLLLSINRFERKKNIELALESYSLLLHSTPEARNSVLVIAGGYDSRIPENMEYLSELRERCAKYRLPSMVLFPDEGHYDIDDNVKVVFMPSVPTVVKDMLLERARLLLYTPTNEHFGIVPLEAMRVGTPVLATNTGGPLETVVDGETGFLREADMEAWYKVLGWALLVAKPDELERMGEAGRRRVQDKFSLGNLSEQLDVLVEKTKETKRPNEASVARTIKLVGFALVVAFVVGLISLYYLALLIQWLVPILIASSQW